MSLYIAAIFCIICLCVSLFLHDSCSLKTSISPYTCDLLRRCGTLCVIAIALIAQTRAKKIDESCALFLVAIIGLCMISIGPK